MIEWSRPAPLVFSKRVRLNSNHLMIDNFEVTDFGIYICKLFTSSRSLLASNRLNLMLETNMFNMPVKKPKSRIILDNEFELAYSGLVKIECDTSKASFGGEYSIEWIRTGTEMPANSYLIDNSLIINQFSLKDLGQYSCVVSNSIGRTVNSITFYDEDGILKYLIDNSDSSSKENKISGKKLDKRLKILFGSAYFKLGDSIAIQCFDLCNFEIRIHFFLAFNSIIEFFYSFIYNYLFILWLKLRAEYCLCGANTKAYHQWLLRIRLIFSTSTNLSQMTLAYTCAKLQTKVSH
jgi:hypothetical protein